MLDSTIRLFWIWGLCYEFSLVLEEPSLGRRVETVEQDCVHTSPTCCHVTQGAVNTLEGPPRAPWVLNGGSGDRSFHGG